MTPAPGPSGEPLELLLGAVEAAGWTVALNEPVYTTGVNPTRVDLRLGKAVRPLLLYSWYATHEGKGRKKDNLRIQTTRSHDGLLRDEPGRTTIGIGWEPEREVFVAFDGWTKRETGTSSSVHSKASLLDQAAADGWAEATPYWDPRAAFTSGRATDFLAWVQRVSERREAWVEAVEYDFSADGKAAMVVARVGGAPATYLRGKDILVLINKRKELINNGLWQVTDLRPRYEETEQGRKRAFVVFECVRIATVKNQNALDFLLNDQPR